MSDTIHWRYKCDACEWIGLVYGFLSAPNPFDPTDTLYGCPNCKAIDSCSKLCDEPECRRPATSGTPHADGYKSHCYEHPPK